MARMRIRQERTEEHRSRTAEIEERGRRPGVPKYVGSWLPTAASLQSLGGASFEGSSTGLPWVDA